MTRKETTMSQTHSVLTPGTIINGKIIAEEDLRIDGTIEGEISCNGKVIVGHSSVITGNIHCTNIELLGKIIGNISCTSTVILRKSSKIIGDIKTQAIEIEPGASFSGACSMITE